MKRVSYIIFALLPLLVVGCKGEKKLTQYSAIYDERPSTLYVAPLTDLSTRRAVRERADSLYNLSLNIAAKQLYLTAAAPMVSNGYYVLGPLAAAQLAVIESSTGKELRSGSLVPYYEKYGVDAVLLITLHNWSQTNNEWTVWVEYLLKSTRSGAELMHVMVKGTKQLMTDYKGYPKPLESDLEFARRMGCDQPTAQRCQLVETLNKFVLKDLPSGKRSREQRTERYIPSHPEYYRLVILNDGSVAMTPGTGETLGEEGGFNYE